MEHHAFAGKAAGLRNLHQSTRPNVVNCAEQRDPPANHLQLSPWCPQTPAVGCWRVGLAPVGLTAAVGLVPFRQQSVCEMAFAMAACAA